MTGANVILDVFELRLKTRQRSQKLHILFSKTSLTKFQYCAIIVSQKGKENPKHQKGKSMTIFRTFELNDCSAATLAKKLLVEMQKDSHTPERYREDISAVLEKYKIEKQRRDEKAKARRIEKSDKNFGEYKNLLNSYSMDTIHAKSFAIASNVSTQKASAILRILENHGLLTKEYTKDGVIYHRVEAPVE